MGVVKGWSSHDLEAQRKGLLKLFDTVMVAAVYQGGFGYPIGDMKTGVNVEKLVANAEHLREAILLDSRGGYFPQKASCDATCQILADDKYATLAKQWATSKMLGTTVRHFAEQCVYEFRTMLAHLRKKFHAWQQLHVLQTSL